MPVPGSHVLRQGHPRVAIELEAGGYEIRDCIHVVAPTGIELWWLARWPVVGSVTQNALKHGTGPINVDACRVFTDWQEADRPESWARSGHTAKPEANKIAAPPGTGINLHPGGRWPPNLVYLHADRCVRVGEKRVNPSPSGKRGVTAFGILNDDGWKPEVQNDSRPWISDDGKETVPAYVCASGCPVAALDEMSGVGTSRKGKPRQGPSGTGWGMSATGSEYDDQGGASRFFPCFESRAQLDDWFARLIQNPE
jgi:hypothetical protein